MYLQVVLVALLVLCGLASPAPQTQGSSAPQERVVTQTLADASAGTATANRTGAPGATPDGVSLKKLDIAVPPVKPSGATNRPARLSKPQAAPGVVVADQLAAPSTSTARPTVIASSPTRSTSC